MYLRLFLYCLFITFSGNAMAGIPSGTDSNNLSAFQDSTSTNSSSGNPIFDGFSIGGHLGFALFHGDLANYDVVPSSNEYRSSFRPAWNLYAKRDIKFGLGAMLKFEKGSLAGGSQKGKQSDRIDFETDFYNIQLLATFNLLDLLSQQELEKRKFYINAHLGIGMAFYRSLSFWTGEDARVREFVGYEVSDLNPPTQRYTTTNKAKAATSLNVPVGFTMGYRINYKTDITLDYSLTNMFTDQFDTFSRDFSARDKYSFIGVGIRYNFNRSKSDYPAKKPKLNKSENNSQGESSNNKSEGFLGNLFKSNKDNSKPNDVNMKYPITSKQGMDASQTGANVGELDDIKMKMFELQLKLFEMQYLINNKTE